MKTKIPNIFISVGVLFALTRLLAAGTPTFITFDVPGAVFGTFPFDINPSGTITGAYVDASFVTHGYVRAPGGAIITFDVPGAFGTGPVAINPMGTITGSEFHPSGEHGFIRIP